MVTKFVQSPLFVWVDLEMTGLDVSRDVILEVACIITDCRLNSIAQLQPLVVHQPDAVLSSMNEWCQKQHTKSGLVDAVRASTLSIKQAEELLLSFIKQHCKPNQSPLCGNSVWMDRLFLQTYMPSIVEYMHYRLIDVSTVKQLVTAWFGKAGEPLFAKKSAHRALDDLHESIAELTFYRDNFFVKTF